MESEETRIARQRLEQKKKENDEKRRLLAEDTKKVRCANAACF